MNRERVALIALDKPYHHPFHLRLQECVELIEAADFELVFYITQASRDDMPFYIGTGKLDELIEKIEDQAIDTIITLDELSPSQHRNLERALSIPVLDRTQLILMIFGRRAQNKEAKLQVEAARLSYLLPRMKTNLNTTGRQQGGAARTRGSGESQIDLRRRTASKQVQSILKELKLMEEIHATQSQARRRSSAYTVALVGYTNVGKSSLLNALLSKLNHQENKQVVANDRLFETLSISSRHCKLNGIDLILSDTVGFVSDLPHSLIKAFHSTLMEVNEADLLIHVLDASSDQVFMQEMVTLETLKEIGIKDKPILTVYNKSDLKTHPGLCISAHTGFNLEELIHQIEVELKKINPYTTVFIPFENSEQLSDLKKEYPQAQVRETENGYKVTLPFKIDQVKRIQKNSKEKKR